MFDSTAAARCATALTGGDCRASAASQEIATDHGDWDAEEDRQGAEDGEGERDELVPVVVVVSPAVGIAVEVIAVSRLDAVPVVGAGISLVIGSGENQ